jgi:tetratricopeptide (TPR) repeat protein
MIGIAWCIGSVAGRLGGPGLTDDEAVATRASPAAERDGDTHSQPASVPVYEPPQTYQALKDESFQAVSELLQRAPNDAAAFEKAAQLAGVFGEKELASRYWLRSVELAPHFMRARYYLASFALQDGRYEDMARYSREALALAPGASSDATVFRDLLGCALVELGDSNEAREVLNVSVRQQAATCDTFTLLGKACLSQRNYTDAAKYYREAIKIDPAWSKALYGLATAIARLGKKKQAKELFERFRATQSSEVVKSKPEQLAAAQHDVAMIYNNVASLYNQYGDSASAAAFLHRARQLAADGSK